MVKPHCNYSHFCKSFGDMRAVVDVGIEPVEHHQDCLGVGKVFRAVHAIRREVDLLIALIHSERQPIFLFEATVALWILSTVLFRLLRLLNAARSLLLRKSTILLVVRIQFLHYCY